MGHGCFYQVAHHESAILYRHWDAFAQSALISDTEKDRREVVRQRAQRRAAGMTERAEYEANATERARPWEAEGISRATWYRRHSDIAP